MRALLSLALLLTLAGSSDAQPTREASEVRLSIKIKETDHYRLIDGWYGPVKAYAGTSYDWRGLADGDRISEVEFYRLAGDDELAERIARTKRRGRIVKWAGAAAASVGAILFYTYTVQEESSDPDIEPDVVLGMTGAGLGLTGVGMMYIGSRRADGNQTSVNEAVEALDWHRRQNNH